MNKAPEKPNAEREESGKRAEKKKEKKAKSARKKTQNKSAAVLTSDFSRIKYTYKEGSGKRPTAPLRPAAKPPRRLYSPIEADEL